MPLAEAKTILGEPLEAHEHDFDRDIEDLRTLAVRCRQFSPICGLDEHDTTPLSTPDGLLLDITGCGHLFGGEDQLAARAVHLLSTLGLRAKAGVGPTVGIAWAAARSNRNEVLVVSPEQATEWLDHHPIRFLRLEAAVIDGLAEFDLETIGQLRRLPRTQLPSRFGNQLLHRLDQADGVLPEPITPVLPVEVPRSSWRTDNPLRRPDLLPIVVERLLTELADKLPEATGITQLTMNIGTELETTTFDVSFAKPTRDPKRFIELTSLRLERLSLPSGIDRISTVATQIDLISKTQTNLFGDPLEGEKDRELSELIEQLSGRIGTENVRYAHLTADPLPERMVEWSPAISGRPRASAPSPDWMTRPTTQLQRPEPIAVWTVEGRPVRVEYEQHVYNVVATWGPERIESGWWREDDHQRDYYRVELHSGDCLWLFWNANSAEWFRHGAF